MFTGIVAAVGRIEETTSHGDGLRLAITPGTLDVSDVGIGDSVAVNGCCLTVVAREAGPLPRASTSTFRPRRCAAPSASTRRARSTWRRRCASPTGWAAT